MESGWGYATGWRMRAWIGRLRQGIPIGLALLLLAGCESATERPPAAAEPAASAAASAAPSASASAEGAWRATSAAGRFRIVIRPEAGRVPIGPLHAWIVSVETPDGRPADVRQLVFDGGMPQHGHGFDTKPQVTDQLGPGVFRVDGVRFHMAGRWQIRVDAAADGAADVALFDVDVEP